MLYLYIKAPFAAFRGFSAGSFRPTSAFITPTATYGLLMNIAGIETRRDNSDAIATDSAFDTPALNIALGAVNFPEKQGIYQQLHNYPVGASGKENKARCWGSKYNIQPIRREFLSNLSACIAVRGDEGIEQRIIDGLNGKYNDERYGVLFLGDNSYMPDVIKILDAPIESHWYRRLSDNEIGPQKGICRMTLWIDRNDMSKTQSALFYPEKNKSAEIPDMAWCQVGPLK